SALDDALSEIERFSAALEIIHFSPPGVPKPAPKYMAIRTVGKKYRLLLTMTSQMNLRSLAIQYSAEHR
ncbi:MAG: hypothetical protein M3094_03060, partial [Actinomycetia bacterium]|nr:hypothetical protein [Actinomycetes bacterium]